MTSTRRLGFAMGHAGFELTNGIVVAIAVYFYLPPKSSGLASPLSDEIFFGVFTVFGLAMMMGRVFDALTNPIVGYLSDRSRSRLGRRRVFMMIGVLPMVVLPVLLFYPPAPNGSWVNGVYLATILSLYFIAFTIYAGPFYALVPELAIEEDDRVRLARLLAYVAFPVVGLFGPIWQVTFDVAKSTGVEPVEAVRWVVWSASGLAALLCLGPIIAVDEARHAQPKPSDLKLRQAFSTTVYNRPFMIYLLAQAVFLLAVGMFQPMLPYYATVVLGRGESAGAYLGVAFFLGIVLGFASATRFVAAVGPKRGIVLCCFTFSLIVLPLVFLSPDVAGGPNDFRNWALLLSALFLAGMPVAGFFILPHVLIGQIIDADQAEVGTNRSAIYIGVQGFATKGAFGVSAIVLSYLFLRFGNSMEEPAGVLWVAPISALLCLFAAALYLRYPEQEVVAKATVFAGRDK